MLPGTGGRVYGEGVTESGGSARFQATGHFTMLLGKYGFVYGEGASFESDKSVSEVTW